jgi:sodium-dependent phosphate cotransporter
MSDRLPTAYLLPVGAVVVVGLFLVAVQLLGAATSAAAPALERLAARVLVGDLSALGLSWLGTYALGNGSVIAALSLSLFTAGLVSAPQAFLLIAGSRLGSAAVVVFVGALDFLQRKDYSLQHSISMGLLVFLLTHSIYLPATLLGYLLLPALRAPIGAVSGGWTLGVHPLAPTDPFVVGVTARLGPLRSVVLAVALLLGSLHLFDRLLERIDTSTLRHRFFDHFERTWVSFAIGLFVTGVSTSVAFSLGVIVPLYNRGYVERDELVPYVLGANLGTLLDTLVVALVLDSPVGVTLVVELLAVATLLTVGVLAVRARYIRLVAVVDDRLLADRRVFVAVVLSLLLVPVALVVGPLAMA